MDNKENLPEPTLTLSETTTEEIAQDANTLTLEELEAVKKEFTKDVKKASLIKLDLPTPEAKNTEYDFDAIYDELHTKFPKIINMEKPVLLAIAIRQEMLKEVTDVPNRILQKWIGWYFRKSNYYALHEIGAMRYNLDGSEAGSVTKKDQAKRDKQLARINKKSDSNSKDT